MQITRQAYRFALDPTAAQEALLGSFTGASRFWFNKGLALVRERLDSRDRGEDVRVPWSYKELCSAFKGDALKDELAPWRSEVPVGSYQAGLEALGRALQSFSLGRKQGRRVGFPGYRSKGRCREAVIFQKPRIKSARQVEFDRRLGPIRTKERMSKLIQLLERDERARIMRATVSRQGLSWYVSFTVQRSAKQRRARQPDAAVGVDVGLSRLATLSTGELCANGRPLQEALRKLRRLQRMLDRQRRANNPWQLSDRRVRQAGCVGLGEVEADATHRGTLSAAARAGSQPALRTGPSAHHLSHARVRLHRRRDTRDQEPDGKPPPRTPHLRCRLGCRSGSAEIQDFLVGGLRTCCRRPLLPLIEDLFGVRDGESQAAPV